MDKSWWFVVVGLLALTFVLTDKASNPSNELAATMALKTLGNGSKIIFSEHLHTNSCDVAVADHIFIGKTKDAQIFYVRIRGEKVVKLEQAGWSLQ